MSRSNYTEKISKFIKDTVSKVNPLDKPVDKNNTNDTGIESIKLANKTIKDGKNTIKTVKSTVNTVEKTIRTTKSAVNASAKTVYKTARFTVKATVIITKFISTAVTNVVAFISNPVILLIAAFLIIVTITAAFVVMLLGGGASSSVTNGKAQAGAVGLGNVPLQYAKGIEYFDTAAEKRKNEFFSMIDAMYYNYDDLTHSDLVYMEKTSETSAITKYERSFSSDEEKTILKSAWDISLDKNDALAIAYVYLEKKINEQNNTKRQIYEVKYTQEVFDTILSKCVTFSNNQYTNQACPDRICTAHVYDNPDYQTAFDNQATATNAFNDWYGVVYPYMQEYASIPDGTAQSNYWDNNIQWRIDNWNYVYSEFVNGYADTSNFGQNYLTYLGELYENYSNILNNTPPYLIEEKCDLLHTLNSIGLAVFSVDDIISALEFDASDIQWYELTKKGFESNPELQE